MDFVSDALADGRAFRCFTLVDDFTRECPAIEVPAWRVVHVLERIAADRGLPASIVCDNGQEFAGKVLDRWAHERGVVLQFIRPLKPVENAYIESFNWTFRDECLNAHWFVPLTDAQPAIDQWRIEYNEVRDHKRPGRPTPAEFTRALLNHPPSPERLTTWLLWHWGGPHYPRQAVAAFR